ncbi:hypothetical protein EBT31_04305, partial [bacterium]|nr:hypothetical protein [bacterium]
MGRVIGHAVRPARRTRSGREPVVAFIPVVYVQEERSSRVVEFCPRMGEPGDFVGAEGLLPWGATLDEVY